MYTNDNQNLCDLCFTALPTNGKRCTCCDGRKNIVKYPTSLPEGTILAARYCVGRVLGKGGFGVTYLCYDLKENKKVAIKEYLPDALAHRDSGTTYVTTFAGEQAEHFSVGAAKFYDEASLVSRFNGNPNIISVYEFFHENNTTYFVMEYLSGMDMKRYLKKRKKITEGEVLYIADRVTEALAVIHSMNVFHRDIAPDNIFLTDSGAVKLIDFGAARSVMANESKSLSVIIKHGFAPLEQYQRKGNQGPWTDIYALGAALYLALTGNMIEDAMTRYENPALELGGVNPALAKIIEKMLAVRIEDRYHDVLTLRHDLAALASLPEPLKIEKPKFPETEKLEFYCQNCGKLIHRKDIYCDECKAAIDAYNQTIGNGVVEIPATVSQPPKKSRTINLIPIIIAVLLLPVVIIGAIVGICIGIYNNADKPEGSGGDDAGKSPAVVDTTEQVELKDPEVVDWMYYDGVLEIFGEGDMNNYEFDDNGYANTPWYSHSDEIEEIIIEDGITSIGECAFYNCINLTKITIPDSVKKIGYASMAGCASLESVTLPGGITSLEVGVFYYCTSLKDITIPEGVTVIRDMALSECTSLESITIPESVTLIGEEAFFGCTSLETVIIDNTYKNVEIEENAFPENVALTYTVQEGIDWTFENGVLTVTGSGPMKDYELVDEKYITTPWFDHTLEIEKIVIKNGVTSIGDYAFALCKNVTSITIPNSVTEIGFASLAGVDGLKSIALPENLTKLDMMSFYMCTGLKTVTIPESVTYIGASAFDSCTNLETVVIQNKKGNITIDKSAFPEEVIIQYTK